MSSRPDSFPACVGKTEELTVADQESCSYFYSTHFHIDAAWRVCPSLSRCSHSSTKHVKHAYRHVLRVHHCPSPRPPLNVKNVPVWACFSCSGHLQLTLALSNPSTSLSTQQGDVRLPVVPF